MRALAVRHWFSLQSNLELNMGAKVIKAIEALDPEAKVSVAGNNINGITWYSNPKKLTKKQIQTKLDELQVEFESQAYARSRYLEYPDIKTQLDDLYHNGLEGWKTTIKAIKDKYPKA